MGSWGPGSFENDAAWNWLYALDDDAVGTPLLQVFAAVLDEPADAFIEELEGSEALAAAEVVAAAVGTPMRDPPEDVSDWLARAQDVVDETMRVDAVRVVKRVRERSVLRSLWEESEPTEWFDRTNDLAVRLVSSPPTGSRKPKRRPRKRAKWGAVIQVRLPGGYRYIHWVGASWHTDLVRVLPGFFRDRPPEPELDELVSGPEAYKMQVFLRNFLREPNVRVVKHFPPTGAHQVIPAIRVVPRANEGDPDGWSIIDEYDGPQPPPQDHELQLSLSGAEYARRHPEADRSQLIPWSIPMTDTFMNMLNTGWLPERAQSPNLFGWATD